jgi:predicted RNase H-like HicB family nuclease
MRIGIEAQLTVTIRWDDAAQVFVSYAPALDIYSQAPAREAALRAIESAIRLHLVTALEVDKLDDVLKQFGERASSGIGPEPLTPAQYIKVHQGSGCEIKALPPLALAQG